MKNKSYTAIDIAKYVSALLVVCIHTYPFYEFSPAANMLWIQVVCRCAVPFFFTVSAFLFFSKIDMEKGPRDADNRQALWRYVKRIAVLYALWTILYLPYTFVLLKANSFTLTALLRWVFDIFWNGSYYHLWFLPALLLGVVIVYGLVTTIRLKKTMLIAALLYAVGMLMNVYGDLLAQLPLLQTLYQGYMTVFTTARNGIFFAPIFLVAGIYLKEFYMSFTKKEYTIGIVVSFAALLLEEGLAWKCGMMKDLTSMYLMLVPLSYFVVGCLLQVQGEGKGVYRFLRQSSLLIYVSHILFSVPLLAWLPDQHLLVYVLTVVLSQLLAAVIIVLSRRFSPLRLLY